MSRSPRFAAILLSSITLVSCGGSDGSGDPPAAANELGPLHVHGLGVNPADEALFVATHTGLFRLGPDESEAVRVGDNYQDTMGFTVVGPDRFLGSGHPDARTDLPPYLGLIESANAGERWEPVSLLGRADFHVLEAARERVYGFGTDFESRREQFLVSQDGGREWRRLRVPESLLSLAINPDDRDEIMVSGRHSLYLSGDAGESWQSLPGSPGLLAWPDSGPPYLVGKDGSVAVLEGRDWREVGEIGAEPAAFEADTADSRLYVALHDGSILQSPDGGGTWELRSTP